MTTPTGVRSRNLVAGPPRLPLPYGLFSVFAPQSGQRWEHHGVAWQALTCDPAGGVGEYDCDDPGSTVGLPKSLGPSDTLTVGEAAPFTVYGHHTCTPVGMPPDEAYAAAVTHLEAREQQAVEQALWAGTFGATPNLAGANGYPGIDAVGDTFPANRVDAAVAMVEAAFATGYGALGVLHMSRRWAAVLRGTTDRGGRLYTRLGTPIVAGSGYGQDRIVATSQMFGYRSDIFPGDIGAGGFDRGQNGYTAIAERTYLVGFDPCGAVQVTIDPDASDSGSGAGGMTTLADNGDGTGTISTGDDGDDG